MSPPNTVPVSQPSASAPNHGRPLQQPKPLPQSKLGPTPAPPLPAPIKNASIRIGTSVFDPEAQKFIIQALCFFDYTPEQVALCLGMLEDGTLEKSPNEVQAAKQFFVSNRGLLVDGKLWERNDAQYQHEVRKRIEQAASEQVRRRGIAREKALSNKEFIGADGVRWLSLSIEARIVKARKASELMDGLMAEEQAYFLRQWQKSQGKQFHDYNPAWLCKTFLP